MVRKLVVAVVSTVALVATMGASCTIAPNPAPATATPEPPIVITETAVPTTAVTATPTSTATDAALGALSGTWKGVWTNTEPSLAVGTFTLTWAQQGAKLVGIIKVVGSSCLSSGSVTGSADGPNISFGAVESNVIITYTGTVSGAKMSGAYTSDCGSSKGTWAAEKA